MEKEKRTNKITNLQGKLSLAATFRYSFVHLNSRFRVKKAKYETYFAKSIMLALRILLSKMHYEKLLITVK